MEGLGCSGNVSNRPQFVGLLTCELTTKPVATQPGSYLLHPFGIATQVAKSSIVFTNFLVALAVASALAGQYSRTFPTAPHATNPSPPPTSSAYPGSTLSATFALSLATHLSLYPVLLLPPLIFLSARASAPAPSRAAIARTAALATAAFVGHHAVVLGLSRRIAGSWDFVGSVYGVM